MDEGESDEEENSKAKQGKKEAIMKDFFEKRLNRLILEYL
jgi:hypothetical protein